MLVLELDNALESTGGLSINPRASDQVALEWDSRNCTSKKFPIEAAAAGPRAMLRATVLEARSLVEKFRNAWGGRLAGNLLCEGFPGSWLNIHFRIIFPSNKSKEENTEGARKKQTLFCLLALMF